MQLVHRISQRPPGAAFLIGLLATTWGGPFESCHNSRGQKPANHVTLASHESPEITSINGISGIIGTPQFCVSQSAR